jgi:GAF domain-containing protein
LSSADRRLVTTLRELGELDVERHTLPEILRRLTVLACDLVPGAAYAGLTLDVDGQASTAAFTDELVPELEQVQNRTDVGPCVEAAREGRVIIIRSTADDGRWKRFSASCFAYGVLSVLAVPVNSRPTRRAALNLYAREENAFSASGIEVAEAFAAQAAVNIRNCEAYWSVRQLADQLSVALERRIVIEQAKGILIASGLTDEEAFSSLRTRSQRTNVKLRDVAARVVADALGRSGRVEKN